MELMTQRGQRSYYTCELQKVFYDSFHDSLINEIVEFAIDLNALGFVCHSTFNRQHNNCVIACCVLENGNIVSVSYDGFLEIWDAESLVRIKTI